MQVTSSTPINAPAERVWQIIGPGFARIAEWASEVPSSAPTDTGVEGDVPEGRVCAVRAAGFDEIVEVLTAYDDERRTLTYLATHGMPRGVRRATNTWSVTPAGDGCVFQMVAEVDLHPALGWTARPAATFFRRLGRVTGADLRHRVETGQPSPRKQAVAAGRVGRLARLVAWNAAFSAASGLAFALSAPWLSAQWAGLPAQVVGVVGLGLVGYGVVLAALAALGPTDDQGRVLSWLDAAWVTGTVTALALWGERLTGAGVAVAAATGLVVAGFGILQWRAA